MRSSVSPSTTSRPYLRAAVPGRRVRAWAILAVLVLVSALLGLLMSWTAFGRQLDNYAYDFLFRLEQPAPWQPSSIILALDEKTLARYGGINGMRGALAEGLDRIRSARPTAVAVDIILAEAGDPAADARLEQAFAGTHNLVLSCDLLPDGSGWEDPIERFRRYAVSVGHVHADPDKYDAVSRDIPLEKAAARQRHWALSLAAYAAARGADIVESPDDLEIGNLRIPSSIADGRVLRVRYAPLAMNGIPAVSIAELADNPSLVSRFAGKVVFAGVTAQNAVRDRFMTPYSNGVIMPGIEMNANGYETIARQLFLTDVPAGSVAAFCLLLAVAAGFAWAITSGWTAYAAAIAILAASQAIPAMAFAKSSVWPWLPGTLTAVLAIASSAAWRHLLVRRQLVSAQSEKNRYQKAMQFVTHEMRTPLTAIQGSSELISRYASMPEAKRTQMAQLINAESKRLARMIETFLSVERLSAGQLELKNERFPLHDLVETCATRARPLAENKHIEIAVAPLPAADLIGDRELMEYALYNLLTNAVKYSPPKTRVTVFGEDEKGDRVRLSVEDQGIGMDKNEASHIFERFYRTKSAEQSGEAGTGIGLSIVEQIVTTHGGRIQVESEPGKGSRFTMTLKRA
jgi:signal transduction histidine kinase